MNKSLTHVILTYNDFDYLEQAIQNSIAQQHVDFLKREILIIDDGSDIPVEDNLHKLFSFQKYNIRILRNPKNLGINASLNIAIGSSRSNYIYLGSSNDKIDKNFFFENIEALERFPKAPFSFSDPGIFREASNRYTALKLYLANQTSFLSPEELVQIHKIRPFCIGSNTVVFRRAALRRGAYKESLGLYADQYVINFLAFLKGCVYIPHNLSYYNIHSNSYSLLEQKRDNAQLIIKFFTFMKEENLTVFNRLKRANIISVFPISDLLKVSNDKIIKELITKEVLFYSFIRKLWRIVNKHMSGPLRNKICNMWYQLSRL